METISLSTSQIWLMIALAVWSITWKAYALWKAAQHNDKAWFVALVILNTAGILDILYIFVFSKHGNQNAK